MKVKAEIPGREWVELDVSKDDQGVVQAASVKVFGCHKLTDAAKSFAQKIRGQKLSEVSWPGLSHEHLLIQEIILKAQERFQPPNSEEELCHCRKIPTRKVDEAIVLGAHTPEKVKAWTGAGSGCGTCRPRTMELIEFRLGKKP